MGRGHNPLSFIYHNKVNIMTNTQQATDDRQKTIERQKATPLVEGIPIRVRPMIQFVPSETFEARTSEARKRMTVVKSRDTIKRNGWYFTEKYPPCGEYDDKGISKSLDDIFGA